MATHASRDTTTGKVNETNIEKFLTENYDGDVHSQVEVGTQFDTKKRHILDILFCLLYTSPSPRDYAASRMPSSA